MESVIPELKILNESKKQNGEIQRQYWERKSRDPEYELKKRGLSR